MLSLYEASFIELEIDADLEAIGDVAGLELVAAISHSLLTLNQAAKEVKRALDLPSHWRFPRLKARWSIDAYDDR